MKRVLFTVFMAAMLVLLAMSAGCTDSRSPNSQAVVVTSTTPPASVSVPYGEIVRTSLDAPATSEVYLSMTARADAKALSGGRSFMRIVVNGKNITGERLVNKNMNFTYGDGFKTTYWSTNMSAWYLFFSPDFVGYDNPKLTDHILEGNAYVYKFDVSDIVNKGAPNVVAIENIGDEVAAQYTKPEDIEFYKAATIVINPIKLEGKGVDVVQITKEAAPVRIIVGKKSTVTLTIRNDLPGSISDVEIADAALPNGLSGQIINGKVDEPIRSGDKYTVSYDVTADKEGTYILGAAAITFADATGNYQKLSSGTVTVTVI
ncbi:MAG: BatD family protein [Methanoregula sp.]|jgi:hypothetical protein